MMKNRMVQVLLSLLVAIALVAVGAVAAQEAAGPATIDVAESEQYGEYLTDTEGNALYVFVSNEATSLDDSVSEGVREIAAECTGGCLEAWPPFTSDGEITVAEGAGLESEYLYTTMIGEHNQVVFNGFPLYTFANDEAPGDTNGQGIEANGATWYLMSPDGRPIDASDESEEAG